MKQASLSLLAALGIAILTPIATFAHVVVTPSQANVGDSVEFSISVPNERETTMTSVKLVIPSGVGDVMPDVAGGWDIATEKSGDTVTSITWTGTIPSGQRADLAFKAQVPAKAGTVAWKAYQTYDDGTVVSWDQKPVANAPDDDAVTTGPYSQTTVVNDLQTTTATPTTDTGHTTLSLVLSGIAFVFSVLALIWRRRRA